MGQQLTSRELSRVVLEPGWVASGAGTVDAAALAAAIEQLRSPVSLKTEEPKLDGTFSTQLENSLRMIGAKVDPGMNSDQTLLWRKAMVAALSDLPGRIAIYAAAKAIHRPYNFLNQVEAVVREIAEEAATRQRLALLRLQSWQREIERATNDQARIEAPPIVWTQAMVDEANEDFARVGIKTRYRLAGEEVESFQFDTSVDEA